MRNKLIFVLGVSSLLFVSGFSSCGGGGNLPPQPWPTPTPVHTATPAPTATAIPTVTAVPTTTPVPTVTPVPTPTPVPTVTPIPTPTPVPTVTPIPTSTPVPTVTPVPTSTPVPTVTFTPTVTPTRTPIPCDPFAPGPGGINCPTPTPGGPIPTPFPTLIPTSTPTQCYTFNGGGWVPCVGSTPTPTPSTVVTPTPCISIPGPGGFDPCPTPTPGIPPTPTTVWITPIPTPVATVTPTPTVTPGGPTPTPTPVSVAGSVALAGTPLMFEPAPPGAVRPVTLSSGFTSFNMLYQKSGALRLLNSESFGYSTLNLGNPGNPTALYYNDMRFTGIPAAGDGQSYTFGMAVSNDGQRIVVGLGGPGDSWGTVAGSPDSGEGFNFFGSFGIDRPYGVAIQHIGNRYIAYSSFIPLTQAIDITTLPSSLERLNMNGTLETTPFGGGNSLPIIAGNYLLFLNSGYIKVINASNPGPVGSITTNMPTTTITSADFSGRIPQYYTASVDPTDNTKLWVLVELRPLTGENSPSYGLVSLNASLVKTSAGIPCRIPSVTGESWGYAGVSAALVPNNGALYAMMPAVRNPPSLQYKVYSMSVTKWGTCQVGSFDIPSTMNIRFSFGMRMVVLSSSGNLGYAYLPTGTSGWLLPLSYK